MLRTHTRYSRAEGRVSGVKCQVSGVGPPFVPLIEVGELRDAVRQLELRHQHRCNVLRRKEEGHLRRTREEGG